MKAVWLDNGRTISADELNAQGVYYKRLGVDPQTYEKDLDRVKVARGYVDQDIVALKPDTPDLEAICARFVEEHLHTDDEARFVLAGSGVFDVRSLDDRWMKVVVEEGDLIVVPESRYHRFYLTEEKMIQCVRLFKDKSGWTPLYRKDRENELAASQ